MKVNIYLLLGIFSLLCCGCADGSKGKYEAKYPVVTIVGEDAYIGEIIYMPNPCITEPCLPGIVLGLYTTSSDEYVLEHEGDWVWKETFTVGGATYSVGDVVETTGTLSQVQLDSSREYFYIEIETITKKST